MTAPSPRRRPERPAALRAPLSLLLLLLPAALAGAGCAQSTGDLDRVQPNALRKADLLEGVWYVRNTVTGASANTGFTFTGETGALEKVVWDVQEGYLVGYRAYPYILGTDDAQLAEASRPSGTTRRVCVRGVCAGEKPYFGAPVVRYRIQGHFDIQRGYDPSTGEQTNVVQENATDRPWNEREYMRVDWSQSDTDKSAGLMWGSFGNASGGASLSSWVQPGEEGSDPYDWPAREYRRGADGAERLVYLDFTSRHYARPDTTELPGYGEVPLCFLWGGARYDCTSQEVKVRTSIARVDPDETLDYEPLVYGNELMAKFGYFRTERLVYDRKFGHTDAKRLLLANRFDLWEAAYQRNAEGRLEVDAEGRVTSPRLPLAQRKPKPIVYYLAPRERVGDPAVYARYLAASRALEAGWDLAFRRAVAAAQGRLEGTAELPADRLRQQVPQMLHVCESPVPQGAPEACGRPGFTPRFGDLRYSFLYTITEPTPNGLLGYGPLSADPETGEIISANANTYAGAVDAQAQYALDVMDLLTGELSVVDHVSGRAARQHVLENASYAEASSQTAPLPAARQGLAASSAPTPDPFARLTPSTAGLLEGLRQGGGLPLGGGGGLSAAAERLRQAPQLEALIVDGAEPARDVLERLPLSSALWVRGDGSLLREGARQVTLAPHQLAEARRRQLEEASRRNLYLAEFMNEQLLGLAKKEAARRAEREDILYAQGKSREEARRLAREETRARLQSAIWRATSEHEAGHTFGLRHNFAGSFDATNYFDRYWELRRPTLAVRLDGRDVVPATPADLRATAVGTAAQLDAGMHEHEYSSIMDYGGAVNADFQGIGRYDSAAILFAYSGDSRPGYVEVFTGPVRKDARAFPASDGTTLTLNGAARDLPLVNALRVSPAVPHLTERFHYTTLPLRFGQGATLSQVLQSGLESLRQRGVVRFEAAQARYAELRERLAADGAATADGLEVPLEVPYLFCTDDHAGYVLACNRFDRGPDYFEMTRSWLEGYWNGYYFSNFARDRYGFTADGAFNRAYDTFTNTGRVYKQLLLALYQAQDPASQPLPSRLAGPLGYDPLQKATWVMGTLDGVNALLRVMQVPAAGFFGLDASDRNGDGALSADEGLWRVLSEGDQFDLLTPDGMAAYRDVYGDRFAAYASVPRGPGRRMYSRYDFKSGYGFEYRMVEAGHYNDQQGAMFAAVADPYQVVLGGDSTADVRRFALPYSLLFKRELEGVFGALWSGDEAALRPSLAPAATPPGAAPGEARVLWRDVVRGEDHFAGFQYPPAPAAPAATAFPVDLESTWTSRIYALYLGLAGFSVNYDFDYARQNQVLKAGGAEDFPPAPGATPVDVEDPFNGVRYRALHLGAVGGDGQPVGPLTPAVRMVAEARRYRQGMDDPASVLGPRPVLKDAPTDAERSAWLAAAAQWDAQAASFAPALRNLLRDLDIMRGFYGLYGKAF
jgi:hypothetical protein